MRNKTLAAVLMLGLGFGGAFAQEPQLAYRILTGYVDKKQSSEEGGKRIGGAILTTVGGLMVGAAATTWFYGDAIGEKFGGSAMDPEIKLNVSLGLGIGGLVTSGLGIGILTSRSHDYRAEYAEVFSERDKQVQEALAVAVLKDIGAEGKKRRVESAIGNLIAPLIFIAVKSVVNVSQDKPWSEDIASSLYWNAFTIAGGISSLLTVSEEERLYDKYLAGRSALYGESLGAGN